MTLPTDENLGVLITRLSCLDSTVWHLKGTCDRMREEETIEEVKRVEVAHSGGKRNGRRETRHEGCR